MTSLRISSPTVRTVSRRITFSENGGPCLPVTMRSTSSLRKSLKGAATTLVSMTTARMPTVQSTNRIRTSSAECAQCPASAQKPGSVARTRSLSRGLSFRLSVAMALSAFAASVGSAQIQSVTLSCAAQPPHSAPVRSTTVMRIGTIQKRASFGCWKKTSLAPLNG